MIIDKSLLYNILMVISINKLTFLLESLETTRTKHLTKLILN